MIGKVEESWGIFRGKNVLLFAILATQTASPILLIILYFTVYVRIKLIDTRLGMIMICLSFTLFLVIWSMRDFFNNIPGELEDAARMDGASDFQTFVRIILLLAAAGAVAAGITSISLCWKKDDQALPGRGDIDWREVAATFHAIGFHGPFVLELSSPPPPESAERAVKFMNRLFAAEA